MHMRAVGTPCASGTKVAAVAEIKQGRWTANIEGDVVAGSDG
jgi:hypothetical protein